MAHAVLHIGAELHARIKQHCHENGVTIKDFVSGLIERKLPSVPQKKPVDVRAMDPTPPWAQPPFWAGRDG